MTKDNNPNELSVVAGDFSLKHKLKKLVRGKKTTSQNANHMESAKPKNRSLLGRKIVAVLVFGTAVTVLAVGSYFAYHCYQSRKSIAYNKKYGSEAEDCSKLISKPCLLGAAIPLFDTSKAENLRNEVEQVKKYKGYDTDPDLLYVVLTYYINVSDAPNAKIYFDKLSKAYDPRVGYSPILGVAPTSLTSFKAKVEFLQSYVEEFNKVQAGSSRR